MKPVAILLSVLVAVLIVVLYWLLLFQPVGEEIEIVQAETERLEAEAGRLESRIAELREVRSTAPERGASLTTAHVVVPEDPGLPALLRQVQQAADDAGLVLMGVSSTRPTPLGVDVAEGLASINISAEIEGSYFQIVDFLRRLEEPAISPRGILVRSIIIAGDAEAYPILSASLNADVFAFVGRVAEEPEEPDPDDPDDELLDLDEPDGDDDAEDAT